VREEVPLGLGILCRPWFLIVYGSSPSLADEDHKAFDGSSTAFFFIPHDERCSGFIAVFIRGFAYPLSDPSFPRCAAVREIFFREACLAGSMTEAPLTWSITLGETMAPFPFFFGDGIFLIDGSEVPL